MILLFAFFFISSSLTFAEFDKTWWQHAVIYDIFGWSFKDFDGDGIGDLKGITSTLDYLQDLGIRVIKLSPIYLSPYAISLQYAVTNFTDVHSTLGTLEDFDELIEEAKVRDIKIILDINFNHCHITHDWFQKAIRGTKPYKNYFIWKDPTEVKTTYCWKRIEGMDQFYYSLFDASKADFNLLNKELDEEINEIMKFWFDRGVAGFNIIEKSSYFEGKRILNNFQQQNQEIDEFIKQLREFVDVYNTKENGHERILMTNVRNNLEMLKYIGNKDFPLVHFVSYHYWNYRIGDGEFVSSSTQLKNDIEKYTQHFQDGIITEWVRHFFYHESFSRNKFHSNLAYTIGAILPGNWRIGYGSEIGMVGYYKWEEVQIIREFKLGDGNLRPMQWDSSKNAGFSQSNYPIQLPNPDYWDINVENQINDENSLHRFFKNLIELRDLDTLKHGDLQIYDLSKWILVIKRSYTGHKTVITVLNLDYYEHSVDLTNEMISIQNLPTHLKIIAVSPYSFHSKGEEVKSSYVTMRPISAVVMET